MSAHNFGTEKNLLKIYDQMINDKIISFDAAQKNILDKLYKLQQDIELLDFSTSSSFFTKIFKKEQEKIIKGFYIYGDVGRGKSMLMDLFFKTCSLKNKQRIHFHSFMVDIHEKLHKWRDKNKNNANAKDPLPDIAKKIAKNIKLLCFDEFQVTDITDAMILARLFTALFKNEVIVVATSNVKPDDLYKNGLQRESFLDFINLLKKYTTTFKLESLQDYRLSHIKSLSSVYFIGINKKTKKTMENIFAELTNNANYSSHLIKVKGRKIKIDKTYADIAWVDFKDLCEQPLGAEDYLEIAREFSTLIMSNIPKMSKEMRNEAKRFVTLIDQLYEHNVKFICSAEVEPVKLYPQGDGSFEFERTVSRLVEMQSDKYLHSSHVA